MYREFIECDKCKKSFEIRGMRSDEDDIDMFEKIIFPSIDEDGMIYDSIYRVDLCAKCYKNFIKDIYKLVEKYNLKEKRR